MIKDQTKGEVLKQEKNIENTRKLQNDKKKKSKKKSKMDDKTTRRRLSTANITGEGNVSAMPENKKEDRMQDGRRKGPDWRRKTNSVTREESNHISREMKTEETVAKLCLKTKHQHLFRGHIPK